MFTHSTPPMLADLRQAVETGDGIAAIKAMKLAAGDQEQIAWELQVQWSANKAR